MFEAVVSARPVGTYLKLVYEDVYLGSAEQRAAWVERIWKFLDLEPIPEEALQRFLDPGQAKLNSTETYHWLPNAREIDEQLGSDDTGWLFDR